MPTEHERGGGGGLRNPLRGIDFVSTEFWLGMFLGALAGVLLLGLLS